LTEYARWLEVKLLDSEWKMVDDVDFRLGYCNYIAHQFHQNNGGAALKAIYIYKIVYEPPQPEEDAFAVLYAQNGPPNWEGAGPSWAYYVADRNLVTLSPGLSRDAQDKLDAARQLGATTPPY
jgi:hypothetical protein